MIEVKIEPREGDRKYEIHVGDPGDNFLVSHQGYERAVDAEGTVRRLWPNVNGVTLRRVREILDRSNGATNAEELIIAIRDVLDDADRPEAVDLTVVYRDGTAKHEMLR